MFAITGRKKGQNGIAANFVHRVARYKATVPLTDTQADKDLGTNDLAEGLEQLPQLVVVQIVTKVLDVDVVEFSRLVPHQQQAFLAWDETTHEPAVSRYQPRRYQY